MGFFTREEISRPTEQNATMLYKHPQSERGIPIGSQLVIDDFDTVIILKEGSFIAQIGPGSHLLTPSALMFLSRIIQGDLIKANFWFIRQNESQKFGITVNGIIDPVSEEIVDLRIFGICELVTSDPIKFLCSMWNSREDLASIVRTIILDSCRITLTKHLECNSTSVLLLAKIYPSLAESISESMNLHLNDIGLRCKRISGFETRVSEEVEIFLKEIYRKKNTPTSEKKNIENNISQSKETPSGDPEKVFVIHGRNIAAYNNLVLFLQALKLDVIDFDELSAECGGSEFIGNIVKKGMQIARGIIVLFTPDECAKLAEEYCGIHDAASEKTRWQARPNVIFEAGMAMGIDEKRTILVTLGSDVKLFSDVDGRHVVRLDNSAEKREILKLRLQGIGCAVSSNTKNLHNRALAGDFEACIPHRPS